MTQPPFHQQPGPQPQQPPAGYLHVHLQGSMMTSNAVTPRVRLNGHPMPAKYGENVFPVPPGPWAIDVSTQWMRTYGHAHLDVRVGEGQHVPVFYAAPMHQFANRGAIGFEKQKRPGMLAFWLVIGAVLAFVALMVVFGALAG